MLVLTGSRAADFWIGGSCLGRDPQDTDLITTEHSAAALAGAVEAQGPYSAIHSALLPRTHCQDARPPDSAARTSKGTSVGT